QTVRNSKTLRLRNGKMMITDGPYAETKEQIGGFFSFEARDMSEAVRLVSNHPGLKAGPFEIRSVEDMTRNDSTEPASTFRKRQKMKAPVSQCEHSLARGGSYEGDFCSHIPQRTTGTLRRRATATYRGSKGLGNATN